MELKAGDRARVKNGTNIYDVLYVDKLAVVLRVEDITIVRTPREMKRDWEIAPPDLVRFYNVYTTGLGTAHSTLASARGAYSCATRVLEVNLAQHTTTWHPRES